MQKIYCRSIRPDGYGEGVVPEMEEPRNDIMHYLSLGENDELKATIDIREWKNHLASLPVLYLIHPDLHKGRIGWVGEHKERYELSVTSNGQDGWMPITKDNYDQLLESEGVEDSLRIVLVPVEGKEVVMTKELLIKIFKSVSLIDLSEAEFEYNIEDDGLHWCNAMYGGVVRDGISWDGNIFRMMNNDESFEPLNPQIDAFKIMLQSKPTPVTGEAGEMNRLSEVVGQWPGDEPVEEIINSVSDNELASLVSEYRLMQRTLINISGLGYQSPIKELCEAASRTSDAVEFAEWKDKYFQFTFVHRGKGYRLRYYEYVKEIPGVLFGEHYDVKDIYTIFLKSKQQTTKP